MVACRFWEEANNLGVRGRGGTCCIAVLRGITFRRGRAAFFSRHFFYPQFMLGYPCGHKGFGPSPGLPPPVFAFDLYSRLGSAFPYLGIMLFGRCLQNSGIVLLLYVL